MTVSELQNIFGRVTIDDVLLSGFVDNDQPLRFHFSLSSYFLECEDILVRISTVGYSGRCSIARVSQVSGDLELDDDMQLALTSVKQMLLRDPDGTNRVRRVALWDGQESPSGIECAAIQLELSNGQVLFFDPSYHFGFRVGGAEQRAIWAENTRADISTRLTEIDLASD